MTYQEPKAIAKDILSYFMRNPQAADNLEGVVRWRLLEQTVHRSVEETDQALEWLVMQGFLVRVPTLGSGAIFRLNPDKRTRAESFLRGKHTTPKAKDPK